MQQTEILSLAERLIPIYHSKDFDDVLSQLTNGKSPAIKLLVKMELNRLMTPCNRSVDLRGRVDGECREFQIDGLTHWLDDVAFNDYHRYMKKYGSYTDGVWEALYNTRNNFRVMKERGLEVKKTQDEEENPFEVEVIHLGYDLKRKENRLRIASQVEIKLKNNQTIHAVTSDLSPSGARFKVPSTFDYSLGDIIEVHFIELSKKMDIQGIEIPVPYRILGIEDIDETDSVKYLRVLKQNESGVVKQIITECLLTDNQRARHNNQDKIVRARTRAFEHLFLKHACQLPVFFCENELKVVLLTESNYDIWQYWHDERNQQTLGNLFNQERMSLFAKPGVTGSSNTIYAFKHEHKDKTLFFSMMMPEGAPDTRKLFWHIGAKKSSWRVFRVSIFELSSQERKSLGENLATESVGLTQHLSSLTHFGLLQEIGGPSTANDYLLVDKPNIPSSEISPFRQTRKVIGNPISVFFDARSQRREPRYQLRSPVDMTIDGTNDDRVYDGSTIDISQRGLNLKLKSPVDIKIGMLVYVDYKELKLYDKSLPLHKVLYKVVRVSLNGKQIQLEIVDSAWVVKITHFFNKLIENNLDRLTECEEVLPNNTLLEALHHILLARIMCSPIFVERRLATLRTKAIGINYPLEACMMVLAKLAKNDKISLEPIFKGHTNTLLATPMKAIDGARPQYNEVYISVHRFGTRVRAINVNLREDFTSLKERIAFIEEAKILGDIYVLRISGMPIFDPIPSLLKRDLSELSSISANHAKTIEREMVALAGYGEIVDITEEVLTRLELC
jgi:hypothetical protein